MDSVELFELESSEYMITQIVNNATFYLTVDAYDIPRYIILEIQFTYPKDGDVNFLMSVGRNQLTKLENSNIITTYADYNGFYLHKNYHNIIIPANSFKSGDKFYLTNLIRNDRRTYQYFLKIRKLPYQPCPKNCSSDSGKCFDGICSCNENIIDLDCSKEGQAIKLDEKIENLTILGTKYFYFQQPTQLEKIVFEMGLEKDYQQEITQVTLYYMFENFIYGVPTQYYTNFTFTKDLMSNSIKFDVSKLTYNSNLLRFNRLIFGLVTEKEVRCNFYITSNSSNESNDADLNIILFVTISIVLFIIFLIIFIVIIRRRFIARQQNLRIIPDQEVNLSIQFLTRYMKKAAKRKKDQQTCSICLDDKKGDLRQTLCKHQFHVDCLYNWLIKCEAQYKCPNCREIIDLEKIKKSFKPKSCQVMDVSQDSSLDQMID
ncbi:unnamed protein product (macronuclear) [Paramecium tetraurelia]|uniref:RING-type domain-containing protein n=1 Tax=Paramecium tetraurelia TaxID=5888 RepID=A0DYY2_PARTE|nr:uncharacterized protein GSPATT00003217001 [Paramecium tetraurelia]CAK88249.1 unnamed protein product [Paramecium tetraurelia]|eukprot:XP_001455646.1 hypothetical protein (macronuclear) [Paramecium tetraurelia strain d4-2]